VLVVVDYAVALFNLLCDLPFLIILEQLFFHGKKCPSDPVITLVYVFCSRLYPTYFHFSEFNSQQISFFICCLQLLDVVGQVNCDGFDGKGVFEELSELELFKVFGQVLEHDGVL
jgi:hypothetical protein